MVYWTVSELREFLELIEEGGDGDKLVRFDYCGTKYTLDWPVTFERGKVKKESFTIRDEIRRGEEITSDVMKDTVDFMIERDYTDLPDEEKMNVLFDTIYEVKQMITDYDNLWEDFWEEEEEE